MKLLLPLFLAIITSASGFDQEAFGQSLNGWQRDGSAHYTINGIRYRTSKPEINSTTDGGKELTAIVSQLQNGWAGVSLKVSVNFGPDNSVQAFRVQGEPQGRKLDTGVISRPTPPAAPAPVEGQPAPAVVAFEPIAEMKRVLIENLNSQLAGPSSAEDMRKRDILARIASPASIDSPAITAGILHNLERILAQAGASK